MGPEPPSQSLKSAAAVVRVLKVRVVGRQELQRPAGLKFQHVSCHGLLLRLANWFKANSKLVQSWFKAGSQLVQNCFETGENMVYTVYTDLSIFSICAAS